MTKTYSQDRPERLVYMSLPDGQADVWLHVNIVQNEEGWEADENYFRCNWSREYVEEHFDELLDYAPYVEPTTEDLLLETAADHEYRICLIELGVSL